MEEEEQTTPEVTPEEPDAPVEEAPAEGPPAVAEETTEDDFLAIREEVRQIGARVRKAGLGPIRRLGRAYADGLLDAVEGFVGGLEGKKKED